MSPLGETMIRTETEYQEATRRFRQDREVADQMRAAIVAQGLEADEVEAAMEPMQSWQAQLSEEITWYENVCRGHYSPAHRLTDLGRLLIALRIAGGLTQSDLAARLGVSESSVSRDERNEYHGITLNRAQRVLDALGAKVTATVTEALGRPSFALDESPAALEREFEQDVEEQVEDGVPT